MELLVELDRRSSQIEVLAVELSMAIHAADLERASRQLDELRDEIERAALALAALKVDAEFIGASAGADAVAGTATTRSGDDTRDVEIASKERVLAERLIAVLVQLANLRHLASTSVSMSFAGGLMQLEDVARFVHEQIGRLNAAWLSGKRTDPAGALARAHEALMALGEHRGVIRFLSEASCSDSKEARTASLLIAALIGAQL